MARTINKLTAREIEAARGKKRLGDGGGLYLRVTPGVGDQDAKSWSFMWTSNGKRRELGLGPYPSVTLKTARTLATTYRELVANGGDPAAERHKQAVPTFEECVDRYITAHERDWSNPKHKYQWKQTLGPAYCAAILSKTVSEIGLDDVLRVLTPIWTEKPETASRLRGRIERVLNFAKVHRWREGENPAAWRGNLDNLLPKLKKRDRVQHHPALPYEDVPHFVKQLQERQAVSALALHFLILTAARTGEVIGATWDEMDFQNGIWIVPAERMKLRREHRVPLSKAAMSIIERLHVNRTSEFVFPGHRPGKPLSNMAMSILLKRMKFGAITVHGFRSSFRDWAGDKTAYRREIAEGCLAHRIGDDVEQAYRRRDGLEKRRNLLEDWSAYVSGSDAKVIRLKA